MPKVCRWYLVSCSGGHKARLPWDYVRAWTREHAACGGKEQAPEAIAA